jgi:hypothetical protein
MNWRQRIITDWPNDPQRSHKCQAALKQIEEGLLQLASLGHPLHVEEGYVPPPPPEFPKVMFHLYQGGKVFVCQADVDEAGEDWYPTMEEARHAAGVTKQNQRGGIFTKTLPAVPIQNTLEAIAKRVTIEEEERAAAIAKKQFIEEARAEYVARNGAWGNLSTEKRNAREV